MKLYLLKFSMLLLCGTLSWFSGMASDESSFKIDSIKTLIATEEVDSTRYNQYSALITLVKDIDRAACVSLYEEQLDIAKSLKDKDKIAAVTQRLGGTYMSLGNSQAAFDYLNRAHKHYKELGDIIEVSYILNDIALLHQRENRYEEAIETYQQVIVVCDSIEDYIGEMIANVNLMSLFMDLDDNGKGLEYGAKAIQNIVSIPDSRKQTQEEAKGYLSAIYLNMGLCYSDTETYNADSALYYLEEAYTCLEFISDEYSKTYYKGYIDNSKGDIQFEMSQRLTNAEGSSALLSTALSSYRIANESFLDISEQRGQVFTLNNIGKTLNLLGQYESANSTLRQALEFGKELNFKEEIRDSYENLAENAAFLKDYKSSNEFLKLFMSFKDSINNAERDKIMIAQEVRFETSEMEKDNIKKEKENIKLESANRTQSFVFAFSLFGILGLAYIIYARLRFNKQKELANYEREINKAMSKFVPMGFLNALGYDKITDVKLGDQVEKEVTVLFTDIRSFTTLSEGMSPHENFAFVKEYAERMGPIIERNNGFISQYLGDGIMAIFQKNPTNALLACLAMQEDIMKYNQELQKRNMKPIKVGMGMHTGPLVMGIIGDETRWDATLISDTVNTAARIESKTKEYTEDILLSESTARRIETSDYFTLRHMGEVNVKGRRKAVGIYTCEMATQQQKQELKAILLD